MLNTKSWHIEVERCWAKTEMGSIPFNKDDNGSKNVDKNEFAFYQTLLRLFRLDQFFKCWPIFLEFNS